MAAPMGMDRPKVKMAGTRPHTAPMTPPETRPVAAPPLPRATAPPTADAAATWVRGSHAASRTPSPMSQTFSLLYSNVSKAFACALPTSCRAANTVLPIIFSVNIRSSTDMSAAAFEVRATPSIPRTTSRRLSTVHFLCKGGAHLSSVTLLSDRSAEKDLVGLNPLSKAAVFCSSFFSHTEGSCEDEGALVLPGLIVTVAAALPIRSRRRGHGRSSAKGCWNMKWRKVGSIPVRISLRCSSSNSMQASIATRRRLQAVTATVLITEPTSSNSGRCSAGVAKRGSNVMRPWRSTRTTTRTSRQTRAAPSKGSHG
mmetsp:Transcript_71193/g.204149  ORF Transcript_71193/g.204149 Transcript_71193/m.204149 type:complete len:313 (-) Transcript_71193:183-1121(-)